MSIKTHIRSIVLIITVLAVGCSPTCKLVDGEYLLVKNVIDNDSKLVSKGDISNFLRQKPNRRIFGFYRFHLQVYNLVDQEKLEKRVGILTEKNDRRNLKRKT
ncbi:MAG: hypothetical protein QF371_02465, partial [Flavobacteriales bacterium]|nr:hypothetical protein [Flavobacteriales bacterium]